MLRAMCKGLRVFSVSALFAVFAIGCVGGARGDDLNQEYQQVRKIALKDPRVQDAFAKANERLNERILEIDPSLKPIVDREERAPAPSPAVAQPRRVPFLQRPAAPAVAQQGREHVVVTGETLDSIARHYRVKVAALEKVNRITDARKLRVGQKLIIPGAEPAAAAAPATTAPAATPAAAPAAQSSPTVEDAPAKDGDTFWDRLKNGL